MLSKIEKKKIIDLRYQDYSYRSIHEESGFSIDIIMKICQLEEKQKNQEKEYSPREISNSNDPISMVRRITNDISNIIETRKYDDRDSRKLEKLMKDMQSVLKSEVDDRIPKIRADAIEKSDAQWKRRNS